MIQDIRTCPLFLPDERWIAAVTRYYEDLGRLLGAARADLALPQEFVVPDLWDTAMTLPPQKRETMLDRWHLGHDLARALGYAQASPTDFLRNGVGGAVYLRQTGKRISAAKLQPNFPRS